jgi:hypothetical protein
MLERRGSWWLCGFSGALDPIARLGGPGAESLQSAAAVFPVRSDLGPGALVSQTKWRLQPGSAQKGNSATLALVLRRRATAVE